ncbi:Bor family protein [Bacteriovoracaceae bacterium]|nr:Bor family protein [Bacteriovoracaceae bacterium]
MKKNYLRPDIFLHEICLGVVSLFLFSCSQLHLTSSQNNEYSFGRRANHTLEFKVPIAQEFFLWGLFPEKGEINLEKSLGAAGVHSAAELQIIEETDWKDTLWSVLSLGLYMPRHYVIKGKSPI